MSKQAATWNELIGNKAAAKQKMSHNDKQFFLSVSSFVFF